MSLKNIRLIAKKASVSDEQTDQLADLASETEKLRGLLTLVEYLVSEMERKVISIASSEGAERIFQAKLKAEGAKALARELETLLLP